MENKEENRPETTEAGQGSSGKQMPYTVDYCPHCTFPAEFCEYSTCYTQCKTWLQEHYPQYVKAESEVPQEKKEASEKPKEEEKSEQTAAEAKPSKKVTIKDEKVIELTVKKRGNKKHLTLVSGLEAFGINPKDAAKKFGKRFACGSSVVENNAVEIQGDVTYDLMEYIPKEFKEITEDNIIVKESKK